MSSVMLDESRDTAGILFDAKELSELPPDPLNLYRAGWRLKVGVDVGWLGYPAIPRQPLCFFSGPVSYSNPDTEAGGYYLIDGVAINGVSGGPAFSRRSEGVAIIGVVSAYIPNRSTGETLPGLSVVTNVSHLHDVVREVKSLDEAKEKETQPTPPPPKPKSPKPSRPV